MSNPATLLVKTWLVIAVIWLILPFQLVGREINFYGVFVLLLFMGVFCAAAIAGVGSAKRRTTLLALDIDWRRVDPIFTACSVIAILVLTIEAIRGNYLDLGATYLDRSDRASALMAGAESNASGIFQIGFLIYPASLAYLVRLITFERKLNLLRIVLFGIMPSAMASLVMGGRAPLLYAAAIAFAAYRQRKVVFSVRPSTSIRRPNWPIILAGGFIGLIMLNYFSEVFLVRADARGGIEAAYDNAAVNWGVTFEGPLVSAMRWLLGDGNTYLVFIFGWYMVQGIVMASEIFTSYSGPPTLGIYGIDLVAAVARRLDGNLVAESFVELLDLNVYGFLPSAFGSLFIDLRYFAVIALLIWGWLVGYVYRRIHNGDDARWLMLAPIASVGIVFSVINTPLGFSNGLVTHLWTLAAFWLSRRMLPAVRVGWSAAA